MGTSRLAAFVLICASCGTGDTNIDPGDLELRDLLGIAPDVATTWNADQRASARHVLLDSFSEAALRVDLVQGGTADERIARTLAALDARRADAGDDALALVRLTSGKLESRAAPSVIAAIEHGDAPPFDLVLDGWGPLTEQSIAMLSALAVDAGAEGPVTAAASPRLAVIAGYAEHRLLVNPVLIAVLEPSSNVVPRENPAQARGATGVAATTAIAAGNPYSFYGSVAECAYAQKLRCESCLASSNCQPVTTANDGNAECTTLGDNGGRGYFLLCINLSLAITSVERCTSDAVSGCPQDTDAASDLGQLEANASFLDDTTCASGLDSCLAKIYGAPRTTFPAVDGGMPSEPPRSTSVSCGDSCSDNNTNCDASPSCDCSGPSCGNSLSCDSTCSNNGGSCDSCSSDSSSGSGGGCSSSSSGSGGDCGGGCSGGDCSGGDCSGCGSSSGGSSSGGSCGGSSGSCGDSNCGGSGSCQVARKTPSAAFAVAMSFTWAVLPIPLAALARRRRRTKEGAR